MLLGYFGRGGSEIRLASGGDGGGADLVRGVGGNAAVLVEALRRLGVALPVVVLGDGAVGVACDGKVWEGDGGSGGALAGRVLGGYDVLGAVGREGAGALRDERADGQFALVWFAAAGGTLTLARDPFGAGRLFYAQVDGVCWFADELRALLALPVFRGRRELDLVGLHSYLACSFVAAPRTLIRGMTCVLPNVALTFDAPDASPRATRLIEPLAGGESLPEIGDEAGWVARWRDEFDGAMRRWSADVGEVAVHLSGGLDSGAVAAWLARAGVRTRLFFLDFGPPYDAERPYAEVTAAWLGLPLERVPVSPRRFGAGRALRDLVADLGEPWGDPVTLPLRLGYRAVREAGLPVVFNGEGGDQLLAGWPNRPMLAGELYAGGARDDDRIERYLRTFHHFYGLEEVAYGPELRAVARDSDLHEAVRPYLEESALPRLFDRLRWANYWLKGGQNILPRLAALARRSGVAMAAPFFDRRLARFALTIPPELLLRGTEEKYLLKRALGEAGLLPPVILSRPKRGMGVPATAWCLGPLCGAVRGLLRRLERRDLFQRDYLRSLARGEEVPGDVRGARRAGEKLWQLAMLEVWLETGYDSDE